jgi:hypothetical protein
LSLTDRIQSGGANADRNGFSITYGPFPTTRKTQFDDREADGAMFHGKSPFVGTQSKTPAGYAAGAFAVDGSRLGFNPGVAPKARWPDKTSKHSLSQAVILSSSSASMLMRR